MLAALIGLGGTGYSSSIREKVETVLHKSISSGSLLTTLYRLEEKGWVSSEFSAPAHVRGGRSKRMFKLLAAGRAALAEREDIAKLKKRKG